MADTTMLLLKHAFFSTKALDMAAVVGEPKPKNHSQRGEILLFMLGGRITIQTAAERLATLSLLTWNLALTWLTILETARRISRSSSGEAGRVAR